MKNLITGFLSLAMCAFGAERDSTSNQGVEKIRVGMTADAVVEAAGEPQWKGKTFLNSPQWDYSTAGIRAPIQANNERKVWIVFDSKGLVKEIWKYRACHLGIGPRIENQAEQGGAGEPATRVESDSEGSAKPQQESEERPR